LTIYLFISDFWPFQTKKHFKQEIDGLPFMHMHVQVEKDMEGKEHPKPNRKMTISHRVAIFHETLKIRFIYRRKKSNPKQS
jgi:hypothetical protein